MNKKKILINTLALTALILPAIVAAHGGVDDGHVDADGHTEGASSLVTAGSVAWLGLMAVSLLLMSALSYWVYRYTQVPPVKKSIPENK